MSFILGCAVGVVILFTARESDYEIYKNKEKHNG